jgi:hypothetical protein
MHETPSTPENEGYPNDEDMKIRPTMDKLFH